MSQQINLLDPSLRKKTGRNPAARLAQALAVLIAVLAGAAAWAYHENQELTRKVAETGAQVEEAQNRLDQAQAANVALPKDVALEKKVAALALQLKGEEAVLATLNNGQLGNTEGYSEYMRAFARQVVSGLWLTDFSIRGAGLDMQIAGRTLRAENVPLYIRQLNQESATQGRIFTTLEMREPPAESLPPQSEPQSGASAVARMPAFLEFRLHAGKGEAW